ncbi:MAG: hypothetical protein KAT37_02800 [Candidatus Aenigmarchaeota archaeon]|nr:hypothetical protein [Candidatus Aenigmarchaeota archaeon]
MKKVVICASRFLLKEAKEYKRKLENKGYAVIRCPQLIDQDSLEAYQTTHIEHYKKIIESDILFILNIEKNGISNYIGPSVFAEIAFAIGLNISLGKEITVYCLNPLPEELSYSEELKSWKELGWIKIWKD